MSDQDQTDPKPGPVYSARQARQGDIILSRPWQRGLFATGLIGAIVLALVLVLAGIRFGRTHDDSSRRPQTAVVQNGS